MKGVPAFDFGAGEYIPEVIDSVRSALADEQELLAGAASGKYD